MPGSLIIVHRPKSVVYSTPLTLPKAHWFHFETCLRNIIVGSQEWFGDQALPAGEVFRGEQAYSFLLEVICGLHSPVTGETEVMGQFRANADKYVCETGPWERDFQSLVSQLYRDAKHIRGNLLNGLGSQSYGSLARRYLKKASSVNVLGAGTLAREMLPWLLKKGVRVRIFCRRPEQGRHLQNSYPDVQIVQYDPSESFAWDAEESFVVAAPVPATELTQWIGAQALHVLDMRDNSEFDPIQTAAKEMVTLPRFFSDLKVQTKRVELAVRQARVEISARAKKRAEKVEHRPFGWDDVCA